MLEASIRSVTVTVLWKEGKSEKQFSVTQFVTHPQEAPPELDGGADADGGS